MSGIINSVGSKSGIIGSDVYPAGHVIQTISQPKTSPQTISDADFQEIITLNITPKTNTSKILVIVNLCVGMPNTENAYPRFKLNQSIDGDIGVAAAAGDRARTTSGTTHLIGLISYMGNVGMNHLDDPTIASTPAQMTYKVMGAGHSDRTFYINRSGYYADITDLDASGGASTLTLMEIAQ
jgi:hypothetical protein